MRILWTNVAVSQLQSIHDYLAQTSPDYALQIVDRLTKRSVHLSVFWPNGAGIWSAATSRRFRKR